MAISREGTVAAPTRYALTGGFAMAVVVASMMHAPADPFARQGPLGLFGIDKWVHVGSYALFAALLAYAYFAQTALALLTIAATTILFGIGVELVQSTIPWRTMEFADVVANSIGAVIGLVVWRAALARYDWLFGSHPAPSGPESPPPEGVED